MGPGGNGSKLVNGRLTGTAVRVREPSRGPMVGGGGCSAASFAISLEAGPVRVGAAGCTNISEDIARVGNGLRVVTRGWAWGAGSVRSFWTPGGGMSRRPGANLTGGRFAFKTRYRGISEGHTLFQDKRTEVGITSVRGGLVCGLGVTPIASEGNAPSAITTVAF